MTKSNPVEQPTHGSLSQFDPKTSRLVNARDEGAPTNGSSTDPSLVQHLYVPTMLFP